MKPHHPHLSWSLHPFDELSGAQAYAILRARQDVFVVEQTCPYPDIDGRDAAALHLVGRPETGDAGTIAAYARLFLPGGRYESEASIGRILTTRPYRGSGLGRAVVVEALRRLATLAPGAPVRVSAQAHLQRFYGELGFDTVSEPYDEDGILHVDMVRPPGDQERAG